MFFQLETKLKLIKGFGSLYIFISMPRLLPFLLIPLVLFIPLNSFAQEEAPSYFSEKFQISAGAFFPNFNTDGRLDGDNGLIGTDIDFEGLLGLDDSRVSPYVEAIWRINHKHRLKFNYTNLDRDGTRNLSKTINFNETTFAVGLNVDSEINLSTYRVGYDYSFINDGQKEFGLGVDLDIMSLEASIQAIGGALESENAVIVAPTIGFHGAYAITEKLALIGNFKGLYFDIDGTNGSILNFFTGIEHDTFQNFSTGAGYGYYDVDLDIDAGGFNGDLDITFHGPLVYGKIHF